MDKNEERKARGWVRLWRGIEDSWVFTSSNCIFRVWIWLLLRANHQDGYQTNGRTLGRGEVWTSFKAVRTALRVQVRGGGWQYFDPEAIKWAFRCLREQGMIETVCRTPRGFVVRISNYDSFQSLEDSEGENQVYDGEKVPPGVPPTKPTTLPPTEKAISTNKDGPILDAQGIVTHHATPHITHHVTHMHDTRTVLQEHKQVSTSTSAREGLASPLAEEYQAAYEAFRAAHTDCQRVGYDAFVVKVRAFGGKPDLREAADAFARDMAGVQCLQVPLREFGKYVARAVRDQEAGSTEVNGTNGRGHFRKKRAAGVPLYTDADLAIPV